MCHLAEINMISVEQWRISIAGASTRQWKAVSKKLVPGRQRHDHVWCLLIAILLVIGCVEVNPGPGADCNQVVYRLIVKIL